MKKTDLNPDGAPHKTRSLKSPDNSPASVKRRFQVHFSKWELGCVPTWQNKLGTLLKWVSACEPVKYSNRHLFALLNITQLTFHHSYNTGLSGERDFTASIHQEYM